MTAQPQITREVLVSVNSSSLKRCRGWDQTAHHSSQYTSPNGSPRIKDDKEIHGNGGKSKESLRRKYHEEASRAFKRHRGNSTDHETVVIVQRLVDKTWAKIERMDFEVSRKTFIDKTMFNYLLEKMVNKAMVQQALRSKYEFVDNLAS